MTFLAIRAFLGRLPWQLYAVLAAIGIVLIAYSKGYGDARDKYRRQMAELVASVETAQEQARAAQIAVNQAEQARLDALAERIDENAEQTRIAVADATAAYIDRNRVRPNAGSVASAAIAPASGDDTGSAPTLPASGFVAVSDVDVQRCADATRYAVTAHEFLMGLER